MTSSTPDARPDDAPDRRRHPDSRLAGLDYLGRAAIVVDAEGNTVFANLAAEQLFGVSTRAMVGRRFDGLFVDGSVVRSLLAQACNHEFGQKGQDLVLEPIGQGPLLLRCLAVALESDLGAMLMEFHEVDQRVRIDREERMHDSARANRELVRNLAHEIKNPLGGIRGAAQLLQEELQSADLREYTQVMIKEADRLQKLVDRLLAPHRPAWPTEQVNLHEVCERVRSIVLAEYPQGLRIERDYDASLPELVGDKEQLIQALLNFVRNAAQALEGIGTIRLRTRIARHVVIARIRHKLALELHVIDYGPGIPAGMLDRVFFPLVSGREGGSGLGLPLAQTLIERHGGSVECESSPGLTDFRILLPLL